MALHLGKGRHCCRKEGRPRVMSSIIQVSRLQPAPRGVRDRRASTSESQEERSVGTTLGRCSNARRLTGTQPGPQTLRKLILIIIASTAAFRCRGPPEYGLCRL
ncbi:hypothetical protein HYPSUDRAFT_232388 [Hypholoma sublateritium FD-334 SS-4]|uniref:Uncharacterized protein n=1 Tax=Hypholoma sublateritium (strain FD-334 SS-4) TaxID=945553 RepID=A0A0D2PNH7_HYPSF|nr:hypothetical protein HYPSUDRAFT_232388 [Hypholoma sublateritium FD-334 SS-4]